MVPALLTSDVDGTKLLDHLSIKAE